MRSRLVTISLIAGAVATIGCWDKIVHEMECANTGASTDSDVDSDGDADAAPGNGQGDVPPEWKGFGAGCVDDADCVGYGGPGTERRCITDVMGIINAPGGFCTACCDAPAIDGCAENIDCVGALNAYTICIAHCDSNSDCREDEFWECKPIPYVSGDFPGSFCLPDGDHEEVDTENQELDDPQCPWPWL